VRTLGDRSQSISVSSGLASRFCQRRRMHARTPRGGPTLVLADWLLLGSGRNGRLADSCWIGKLIPQSVTYENDFLSRTLP
jgi:hypothetical protein